MKTLGRNIAEYIEYCAYRKYLDSKTLKAYRINMNQYATFCAGRKDCFGKRAVDDFITELYRQYKPKTVRRKIASLKAFFRHLEYRELLNENPLPFDPDVPVRAVCAKVGGRIRPSVPLPR